MLTWIVLVVLAVGAFVSYSAGVKKKQGWGTPALAVCAVGLYVCLFKVLFVGLIVALGVGVFAGYLKGVKKEQPWGKPVLALCAVALVIAALSRAFLGGVSQGQYISAGRAAMERARAGRIAELRNVATLIGRGLKGHVPTGARIAFLSPINTEDISAALPAVRVALSKELGDESWERAGIFTVDDLSGAIAENEKGINAVISFYGLPNDLEKMKIYLLEAPPKVAAYFGPQSDLDAIRGWLTSGHLQAAVRKAENGQQRLYTPKDLP